MKGFLFSLILLATNISAQVLDPRYLDSAEVENFLQQTHKRYPSITKLEVIGRSVKNLPVYALKISDNPGTEEASEPAIYVNSLHHAREIMTPEITTDMIDYLTSRYASDTRVRKWIDSTEIWIVPMINVDGNDIIWAGDILRTWSQRNNAHGVDLNRNYPRHWDACPSGKYDNSRGDAPGSEPEVKSLMQLVKRIKPVISLSYHSYSEFVVYPPACKGLQPDLRITSFGKELAGILKYKPGQAHETMGYEMPGSDIDWLESEQVFPYLIEVNTPKENFYPDYDQSRNQTVTRNRPGWMRALDRLQESSVRGVVSRSDFDEITISNEGSFLKKYKINPDGSFFVLLPEGVYDIELNGRSREIFENFRVSQKSALLRGF